MDEIQSCVGAAIGSRVFLLLWTNNSDVDTSLSGDGMEFGGPDRFGSALNGSEGGGHGQGATAPSA